LVRHRREKRDQRVFRVKICGITSTNDAHLAARAGADAIGLNFCPASSRWIDAALAEEIFAALPGHVVKVGVFVNEAPPVVCETHDRLGLDLIQLHGDEPPEFLAQLGSRKVMRAFRHGQDGLKPVGDYLARCQALGRSPDLILLDAFRPGHYGGTGETWNWTTLVDYPRPPELPPLVLAGGLRPDSVAEAIRIVGPAAVDVASGVESSPGRKDPQRLEAFVREARAAFARQQGGIRRGE
jgi:phosphoribosylanthranilate isomerase